MIADCEFCGRRAARFPAPAAPICRNLADLNVSAQAGDEVCDAALRARLAKWTLSESGLCLARTMIAAK